MSFEKPLPVSSLCFLLGFEVINSQFLVSIVLADISSLFLFSSHHLFYNHESKISSLFLKWSVFTAFNHSNRKITNAVFILPHFSFVNFLSLFLIAFPYISLTNHHFSKIHFSKYCKYYFLFVTSYFHKRDYLCFDFILTFIGLYYYL